MNAGDAQIYFKPKKGAECQAVFWRSDAAGPCPKLSVAHLCCSAAFLHKGEEACFLVGWDLVLGDMADDSGTVVVAVTLDVPSRAHFYLSVPGRPVLRELFAELVLPCFAFFWYKILVLSFVLDEVAVAVLVLALPPGAAVSFLVVSCCGLFVLIDGCCFGWVFDHLESCR